MLCILELACNNKIQYFREMNKIFFILLICSFSIQSQNLKKVDLIISKYQSISSVEQLAEKINYDFKTDKEKVRAIFSWITLNIKYDQISTQTNLIKAPEIIMYFNEDDLERRTQLAKDEIVYKTIKSKRAVCNGIALTFQKLCNLLSIENELIKGFARTLTNEINYIPKSKNHVWNAVKINKNWIFIDATFGLATHNSKPDYFYFDIKKEELNLTHYPSKFKWVKYFNQKSLKSFCYQPLFMSAYFNNEIKLMEPQIGEIKTRNRKILFKFKNIDSTTEVLYKFEDYNEIKKPQIIYKNSIAHFMIDNPKRNTNLYIYFNGISALAYKIRE
ncbi:Transglutaminase-like superfamily protein [Polaribacter sp. KT25b]|uniref:transglutaminase domain-containing protein n=1 Tax=Polaribacter sp. KT25b TaxID=1855336 RepID=UPI00087B7648|nr:transglutaminase domain-containing protein [Polaribacter sp. KT25b]SDR72665.1 Transglutaminase-like superfamily protein [Polaribacter sp. KT25b]